MRFLSCLLLLTVLLTPLACQSGATNSTAGPAASQPAGALDTVTSPLNQPGFDNHGTMR